MAEGAREEPSPRVRTSVAVIIEDKRAPGRFRGTVADISATGMQLLSGSCLPAATRYAFAFQRTPPFVVRGEVRWVRAVEGDTFACGVCFVDLNDDERRALHAFLEQEARPVPAP